MPGGIKRSIEDLLVEKDYKSGNIDRQTEFLYNVANRSVDSFLYKHTMNSSNAGDSLYKIGYSDYDVENARKSASNWCEKLISFVGDLSVKYLNDTTLDYIRNLGH